MKVERIIDSGLCLGCGMCAAVSEDVTMEISKDGFIYPKFRKEIDKFSTKTINKICPSTSLVNEKKFENIIWGNYENVYSAYYKDEFVRNNSSSGGFISGLAIELLNNKIVDGIMQVKSDQQDFNNNRLTVSKSREEIVSSAGSRYAPSFIFNNFNEILKKSNDKYCFIGKPCDISALSNFLHLFPEYKSRFILKVSIFCAGMPSFLGTEKLISQLGGQKPVRDLQYRGNGWPGFFSYLDSKSVLYKDTYNNTWGKVLNKFLHPRCKICPDGIGLQADIAVGDAWETDNGYPDFEEKKGFSLVIARNKNADQIVKNLTTDGSVFSKTLDNSVLAKMQPYQYNRRKVFFWRKLAFMIKRNIFFQFKGFSSLRLILNNPKKILSELVGSFRRF